MAFGLPAFFGGKARTRIPPGVDVTTITDISGSMGLYAQFITAASTIEALENALIAQGIGTLTANLNEYSFCVGATSGYEDLAYISRPVEVTDPGEILPRTVIWASGPEVAAQIVDYPIYSVAGGNNEDMAHATNLVSNNDRGYTTGNERIIISGSDEQDGMGSSFDPAPLYSQRYVGLHSVGLSIDENPTLPPSPGGELVGFVYTTASEGVAIYMDDLTVNYRDSMPTSTFIATPLTTAAQTGKCIRQCIHTKGALYNIRAFTVKAQYALLAESLGTVLGKYLYSIS